MCFLWRDVLGIGDSEDLSAEATDEGGRLVHGGKLRDGDVCGLVHALPVLDLIGSIGRTNPSTGITD